MKKFATETFLQVLCIIIILIFFHRKNTKAGVPPFAVSSTKTNMSRMFNWHISVEEEMKRYPQLKSEDIKAIREWMATNPHLPEVDGKV